jgi:hypothetical protein
MFPMKHAPITELTGTASNTTRTARVAFPLRGVDLSDHAPVADARIALAKAVEALLDTDLFDGQPRAEAYVTFATPDYHWGLIAWLRSLRKVSGRPVIILAPSELDIPEDIRNVVVLITPALGHRRVTADRAEFANAFAKLWIFAMTPLKRLVFVDVDCLFLKSLDSLFEGSGMLVAPDYVEHKRSHRFNSGMMAITPTRVLEDEIFAKAADAETYDGGDQGTLNSILLDRVTFVPHTFNLLRHYHYFSAGQSLPDARLIHFIVKKPWELTYRETPDALLVDLDDLWTSHLTHDELKALVAHWRREVFYKSERAKIESMRRWGPHDLDNRLGRIEHRMNRIAGLFNFGKTALPMLLAGAIGVGALLVALLLWLALR